MVYGIARIDASGRICERAVITALGWAGGDRLTLTADAGVVTARRDPGGMVTMPASGYITIPAALRRRCGLEPRRPGAAGRAPRRGRPRRLLASPWWTRPSAPTAPSRTRKEDTHDPRPGLTGRVPAGRRGRGAAGPEVDGTVPGRPAAAPGQRPDVPTFADYVPVVSAAVTDGTRKAYGSYWNRVVDQWGARRLDEPTPSEIKQIVAHVRANTVPRRNARGGRSAAENLIAALRCLYKSAEEDGLIKERDNPARKVAKPRRLPSTRRAVNDTRLAEINQIAATTGDDPELDTLILRLHTETACRRGGALDLRPADLDRRAVPDPAPGKGRDSPLAAGLPHPHARTQRARRGTPRPAGRAAAALPPTGGRSPTGATTASGPGSAGTCPGSAPSRSAPTGPATPL